MGACTAVFVRRDLYGRWNVWQGSTQNDEPMPAVGSGHHYGVFSDRGRALCEAFDKAQGLPVDQLADERLTPATLDDLRKLIANDRLADSFQSMSKYRAALLLATSI